MDNNDEILQLLKNRLKLGRERYGHGVKIHQDTTLHGTKQNDWLEMAEEELLDGMIYMTAYILRMKQKKYNTNITHDDIIINGDNIFPHNWVNHN